MASSEEVKGTIPAIVARFIPEKAEGINAMIGFDLSGDNGGCYWLKLQDGSAECGEGAPDSPDMTVKATGDDWHAVATGAMNPMQAFMTGKLKIVGDMGLAMRMQSIFAG